MRMLFRLVLVLTCVSGCAGDSQPEEPVASEQDSVPVIPDMPGEGGDADASAEGAEPSGSAAPDNKFYVTSYSLNVRSGPGMSHEVVGHLTRGEEIIVLEQSSIWLKIGEARYVSRKHVSPEKPE